MATAEVMRLRAWAARVGRSGAIAWNGGGLDDSGDCDGMLFPGIREPAMDCDCSVPVYFLAVCCLLGLGWLVRCRWKTQPS